MRDSVVGPSAGDMVADAAAPEWMPAIDARLTRVGIWMLLIADVLFFAAFVFAFFYLRAMDSDQSWLPPATTHPTWEIGALIVVLMAATAFVYYLAAAGRGATRGLLWLALAAGVVAIGLQVYEFGHLGFDPQQGGGYPSVFVGFKGALLVQFAMSVLWLLTHIAQSRPLGDFEVRRATAAPFAYFLFYLAAIELIAFVLFYLV